MRKDIDPFPDDGNEESDTLPTDDKPEAEIKSEKTTDGDAVSDGGKTPEKSVSKRKRPQLSDGRKIAYAATAAAVSIVMTVLTCYLPITVAPLVMISLSYNIVIERCGLSYGLMTIIASVGLGFLCSAANIAVLLIIAIVFVPYSLICAAIRRFDYSTVKSACVRIVVISAVAALDVLFIYLLGGFVANYADITSLISRIGNSFALGYILVTLVAVLLFLCIDWLFIRLGKIIVKKLK